MNIIHQAIQNLPGHWTKATFDDHAGNHCGLGHTLAISKDLKKIIPAWRTMHETAKEQFPERVPERGSFIDFNDHADTTEADVLAVMEKAAIKLDELEG